MSQHDDQLPEDLRDIAARLSAARATPTALELDELRRRVHARVGRAGRSPQRHGFAGALRTKLVAVLLTMGLVLTSGAGVVLASESFGFGGPNPFGNVWQSFGFHHDKYASWCQYHGPQTWTHSWRTRHSILTVIMFWDCRFLTVHFFCGEPFGFRWGEGPWYDTRLTSYTATSSDPNSPLAVTVDGVTYTLNPDGSVSGQGTPAPSQGTPAPSYNLSFSANGGTGAMAAETENATTALTGDAFSRAGYTFAGWNTAPSGSGTAYANGATYAFAANATLYAQWKPNSSYTVSFNANGGTGAMAAETESTPTALTSDGFTRAGYTFAGWNTAANGSGTAYASGATYAFTASVTLYAQWTPQHRHRRH